MIEAAGEEAVREEFPSAVIIRPSVVHSYHDRFHLSYCNSCTFLVAAVCRNFVRENFDLFWVYP